jgi:hypothetical protein
LFIVEAACFANRWLALEDEAAGGMSCLKHLIGPKTLPVRIEMPVPVEP